MNRVAIAEGILSLVMPPDCAAATAGDLAESSHGVLRFTLALLRTAAAFLMRGTLSHGIEAILGGVIFWCLCAGILLVGQFLFSIPSMLSDPHPLDWFAQNFTKYWTAPQTEFWRWGWLLAGLVSPQVAGKQLVYWAAYGTIGLTLARLTNMPTDGLLWAAGLWLLSLDKETAKPAAS